MAQEKTSGPSPVSYLSCENGARIAYRKISGKSPGVIFFPGFRSDMNGSKALALEAHCKKRGQAFLCFDYQGHGASSGDFLDGCIGIWADDAITVLDQLTTGPQVLVGSSMGGWIMLLVALARKNRIAGLIGLAAAPDFTENMMLKAFSPEQRRALKENGFIDIPNCYDDEPYRITHKLIEDGRNQLVLQDKIDLTVPVRLIQGLLDEDVPWQTSQRLSELLTSDDVEVTFVKNGDHRLSTLQDLVRLNRIFESLLDHIATESV